MPKSLRIDFISDVVCPWCVIGFRGLEIALAALTDVIEPNIQLQPFELNPAMMPEGQNLAEYIAQRFGPRANDRMSATRDALRVRAAEVGFSMVMDADRRLYNTFDAHRLLYWAGLEGRQLVLKHALFSAYFSENLNIADHNVLVRLAHSVGLDDAQARDVVGSGRYSNEVRAAEQRWIQSGINSVPAIVIDQKYLISGGQPAAVFEDSLRRIVADGLSSSLSG